MRARVLLLIQLDVMRVYTIHTHTRILSPQTLSTFMISSYAYRVPFIKPLDRQSVFSTHL